MFVWFQLCRIGVALHRLLTSRFSSHSSLESDVHGTARRLVYQRSIRTPLIYVFYLQVHSAVLDRVCGCMCVCVRANSTDIGKKFTFHWSVPPSDVYVSYWLQISYRGIAFAPGRAPSFVTDYRLTHLLPVRSAALRSERRVQWWVIMWLLLLLFDCVVLYACQQEFVCLPDWLQKCK